ncbi:MAG: hypothetical protein QM775_23725 [Pirellulales bacterium]
MAKGLRLVLLAAVLTIGTAVYLWLRNSSAPPAGSQAGGTSTGTASATGTKSVKPPLDVTRSVSLPGAWQQQELFVKPGHWSSVWFEATSDRDDFSGSLVTELEPESNVRETLAPWGRLKTRRPIVLPKHERRVAEQWLFAPNSYDPPLAPVATSYPRQRYGYANAPEQQSLLRGRKFTRR